MNIKSHFDLIRQLGIDVERLKELSRECEEMACSITAPLKDIAVFGGGSVDKIGDCAQRKIDIDEQIIILEKLLESLRSEAEKYMYDCTEFQKKVLINKYFLAKTQKEICIELHCHRETIRRVEKTFFQKTLDVTRFL